MSPVCYSASMNLFLLNQEKQDLFSDHLVFMIMSSWKVQRTLAKRGLVFWTDTTADYSHHGKQHIIVVLSGTTQHLQEQKPCFKSTLFFIIRLTKFLPEIHYW